MPKAFNISVFKDLNSLEQINSLSKFQLTSAIKKQISTLNTYGVIPPDKISCKNSLQRLFNDSISIQRKCLHRLEQLSTQIAELQLRDIDFKDDKSILKFVLKKYRLNMTDDFENYINEGDVVEIYDLDFVQVYRNWKGLQVVSYDIVDLSHYEWTELFKRHHSVNEYLVDEVSQVLKGPKQIFKSKVPHHLMIESFSKEKRTMKIKTKYGTPVWNDFKEVVGFVCTQTADIILHDADDAEIQFLRSN